MHYVQLRVRRGLGTDDTQLDSFRTFAWTCAPCCLLLLMLAFPALAAEPDPIDAALDACLAKPEGSSTVGMVECTGDAIRAWDKRLNEVYQLVMAGLDPKSQELLRASQHRWVAFREAEHEAMGGPWQQNRGTIIRVLTAAPTCRRSRSACRSYSFTGRTAAEDVGGESAPNLTSSPWRAAGADKATMTIAFVRSAAARTLRIVLI
jgi:uncharacterized protein YecT (DUF1311 family)